MPTYNKLVRDLIPKIIEKSGRSCICTVLDDETYEHELQVKLQEEVTEYLEAKNIEELADIMEVLFALAKVHGADEEQLMKVRMQKREERGGFDKRIFLEKTEG